MKVYFHIWPLGVIRKLRKPLLFAPSGLSENFENVSYSSPRDYRENVKTCESVFSYLSSRGYQEIVKTFLIRPLGVIGKL